jgi:hypothetical protein
MADAAGAFDWPEVILEGDGGQRSLTIRHRGGRVEAIRAGPPELIAGFEQFQQAFDYPLRPWSAAEVHAKRSGEAEGALTYT